MNGQPEMKLDEAVALDVAVVRDFIATYDPSDPIDRRIATRLRERLHAALYRRERERYAAWIDVGGEG